MGRNFFTYFLILLITISSTSFNFFVSSYPNGAGTCEASGITTGHGLSAKSGTGGYSITTSKSSTSSSSFTFTLSGTTKYKGLLIYTENGNSRVGTFTVPTNFQSKTCGGNGTNTLTHTSNTEKSFPLTLSWKPSGNEKNVTIKTVVVVSYDGSYSEWYRLSDVAVDLSTGSSNTTAANDDSTSSSPSTSDGFFQKYTLFVILAIILIILYVSATAIEYMLRKQKVHMKKATKNF